MIPIGYVWLNLSIIAFWFGLAGLITYYTMQCSSAHSELHPDYLEEYRPESHYVVTAPN